MYSTSPHVPASQQTARLTVDYRRRCAIAVAQLPAPLLPRRVTLPLVTLQPADFSSGRS